MTINRTLWLMWAVLGLCQCQSKTAKPAKMLSDADLVKALIRVHTVEATILERGYTLADSAQVAYQDEEKRAFKEMGISYTLYRQTYHYYLVENPQKMEQLYKIVIDSLAKREQKAPNIPAEVAKAAQDSLPKKETKTVEKTQEKPESPRLPRQTRRRRTE